MHSLWYVCRPHFWAPLLCEGISVLNHVVCFPCCLGVFNLKSFIHHVAHLGWFSPIFRYCLTHIRSIALFRFTMLKIFLPPWVGSHTISLIFIVALSFPHMNSDIIFETLVCTGTSIPWALVINCIFPPATIWTMCVSGNWTCCIYVFL